MRRAALALAQHRVAQCGSSDLVPLLLAVVGVLLGGALLAVSVVAGLLVAALLLLLTARVRWGRRSALVRVAVLA